MYAERGRLGPVFSFFSFFSSAWEVSPVSHATPPPSASQSVARFPASRLKHLGRVEKNIQIPKSKIFLESGFSIRERVSRTGTYWPSAYSHFASVASHLCESVVISSHLEGVEEEFGFVRGRAEKKRMSPHEKNRESSEISLENAYLTREDD